MRAVLLLSAGMAALACAACQKPQAKATAAEASAPAAGPAATGATGDQALIESAMKAAPKAVARDSGVVTVDAKGAMRELRKGTNGFTCMPDNPATPGPDPMCGDANAMEWGMAWIGHKPPPANKVGFMYMLAGGTDASNTDPYAKAPTDQNHWVRTGPHVMVVGAAPMMKGYPTAPEPDTTKPYVMWAGTPYEHLMIPVS